MESQAKQHATDQQIQGKEQKGTHGDGVSNFLTSPARASWDLWPAGTEQGISYLSSHPPLLLYEFQWFLCHKGEEKGFSVYQAHSYFSPHFETLFRNPMQLKC